MTQPLRPRRSVLYLPGSNQRALEKARTLAADAVVLDLEDAVAPEQKAAARERVVAAVEAGGFSERELVIRVNGLDTDWGEADLAAVAMLPIAAVCLPKVERAVQIRQVADALDKAGSAAAIWAMIETPRGVLDCASIAAAHPRLRVLVMGTSDLAKEMRIPHTPERIGFLHALGSVVLVARAFGLDALDGVYLSIDDPAGFHQACIQGRELGFDGKTLIHPSQIDAANAVFGPDEQAVVHAERVLAAWEEARAAGSGVAVVDGKLVENLHAAEAERLLAIAQVIRQRGG